MAALQRLAPKKVIAMKETGEKYSESSWRLQLCEYRKQKGQTVCKMEPSSRPRKKGNQVLSWQPGLYESREYPLPFPEQRSLDCMDQNRSNYGQIYLDPSCSPC